MKLPCILCAGWFAITGLVYVAPDAALIAGLAWAGICYGLLLIYDSDNPW